MACFTISGRKFELDRPGVERCLRNVLPDPLHEHYVVVRGRRFPPKQVLSRATGLDPADFTTHHARRILKQLGFVAARAHQEQAEEGGTERDRRSSRQAEALRPYIGQWVALKGPTEVLVAADSPQDVLAWLSRHKRQASYGMFRVPAISSTKEGPCASSG